MADNQNNTNYTVRFDLPESTSTSEPVLKPTNKENKSVEYISSQVYVGLISNSATKSNSIIPEIERKRYVNMYNDENDEMRKEYLNMISKENWKDLCVQIANTIKEQQMEHFDANGAHFDKDKVEIAYNGNIYEFPIDKPYVLIGRLTGCDIQLVNSFFGSECSRVHAFLIFLPAVNKILVIDIGSLKGITTKKRASGKPLEKSISGNRNVLIFDMDEPFILNLSKEELSFLPKTCIVCSDRPREITFGCAHHVCCKTCYEIMKVNVNTANCPICRKSFTNNVQVGMELMSKIN